MAIPTTTDWSKIRYITLVLLTVNVLLASSIASGTSKKQKRQLFREHLIPQQGGKIPDGAFKPDRLALNKLNQNGLFSPDGCHLDQRHPDRHHLPKQHLPRTLKISLSPDDRYVAPPGRYHAPDVIDTTYLIRDPVNYVLMPNKYDGFGMPFLPYKSVKLVRRFKHNRFIKYANAWNEVAPPTEFAEQILMELAPYIQKLQD